MKAAKKMGPIHRASIFQPVTDSRKRKVRGLRQRNGRYYAQLRIKLPSGLSKAIPVPLEVTRLDAAIVELEATRTKKQGKDLHLPGHRIGGTSHCIF